METNKQTPKPQYVAGYVRNKKEIEAAARKQTSTDKADTFLALMLVGSVVIMLAIVFWKVTLSVAAIAAVAYGAKAYLKYQKTHPSEPRLKINYNC